ncbi:MAG TPA: hypothetical protein VNN80_22640 [Polyangiaceae bacterium]|nr:hypothetical protein [Polyangiaceae bacterium]
MSTHWARARAAVIAFLLFFNALAALPTPGEPSLERLQRPFEREELGRWAALFRSFGVDTDPDRLAQAYLAFSLWLEQARAVALSPIEGWMAFTLTHQGWRLFGTPERAVSALRVTAHGARGDEVLYESGDAARCWNAAFLEYRRIRADYNPSRRGPPPTYAAFGQRLSEEIFATMPHVMRVTVALVATRVRLPHEAAPSVAEQAEHVLEFARPGA